MSNPPNQEDDDEEVEEEVPTGSADIPQHLTRDRSRSRDSSENNDLGNSFVTKGGK